MVADERSVDQKIEANWDKIFGKPKADKPAPVKEIKT
jgi:hypothetical protein